MTKSRAELSEDTYEAAAELAKQNGLSLTSPADGCYQMRHKAKGWIINIYPRRNGGSPRMYHDPHHRGPFLDLPRASTHPHEECCWTIMDAVNAAIKAEGATQ